MAPERDDEECSNIVRDERTRPRQAEHQPAARAAIIFRAAGGRTELVEHPTSLTGRHLAMRKGRDRVSPAARG